MPTQEKVQTVEELSSKLGESKGTVVVDYRGLNVADLAALRGRLRDQAVELRVAKNTLLRRAAVAAQISGVDEYFTGPTAIAICVDNEIAAAKVISEAARAPRTPLKIKGGIYGRKGVSADEVRSIAELPPREILLARVLGVVQAPAASALSVVQAPARQILYALRAMEEKTAPAEGAA